MKREIPGHYNSQEAGSIASTIDFATTTYYLDVVLVLRASKVTQRKAYVPRSPVKRKNNALRRSNVRAVTPEKKLRRMKNS